jgi:hypothetical protein
LKSGEMALLGGLRQKEHNGLNRDIPDSPELLNPLSQSASRSENHIELVVLLKATVLDSASINNSNDLDDLSSPRWAAQKVELGNSLATSLSLYQADQNEALRHLLTLLIQKYPDAPEPLFNLALLESKEGRLLEGLALLDKVDALCKQHQCNMPLLTVRALMKAKTP